jgi:hypothetical protein
MPLGEALYPFPQRALVETLTVDCAAFEDEVQVVEVEGRAEVLVEVFPGVGILVEGFPEAGYLLEGFAGTGYLLEGFTGTGYLLVGFTGAGALLEGFPEQVPYAELQPLPQYADELPQYPYLLPTC